MMTDSTMTAESNSADPLRTAADAMALAVRSARDGAMDAQSRVSEAMPAIERFLSRFTYTTCYAISYGVVFPTLLVTRAVPKQNALVHGLIDGGLAARDAVAGMGKKHESDGAEPAAGGDEPRA